jgi:hypothetical protein
MEAQPGLRGTCVYCQSDVIAYCGSEKVWHWKHKRKSLCDSWWENETEWHRTWKNYFPTEWQENIHSDSTTGKKHIADIKTDRGFVIEFQHSAIKSEEIRAREAFYKNMVWVVDGTRLKLDYPRFCKGSKEFNSWLESKYFRSPIWKDIFSTYFPEECFPKRWLSSLVPVYFDFQGISPFAQLDGKHDLLWCIFPGDIGGWAVVANLQRKDFIECSLTASSLLLAQDICSHIAKRNQQQRTKEKEQRELREWREKQRAEAFRQFMINPRRRR